MVRKLKEKEDLSHRDAFTKSAEIWKQLDKETKAKFEAKSKSEEERYQKQLKEYETKGYFTNIDGTKSTDNVNLKPKIGKDIVKPKRPLSAYLYFSIEAVSSIKEKEKMTHP